MVANAHFGGTEWMWTLCWLDEQNVYDTCSICSMFMYITSFMCCCLVFVLKVCLLTSRQEHINNIILSFHSLPCNVDQSPVFNSKLNSYPFSDFDILATDFKYLLSFSPQYWIWELFSLMPWPVYEGDKSVMFFFFFFWRYRASWKRRVIIKVWKAAHKAWYHSVSVITQAKEILTCLLTFTYRYFLLLIFPNS